MYDYKVSVIIPFYNVGNQLKRAVDSILDQTVQFQQIQIILINDGSDGEDSKIAEELCVQYKNIELLHTKHRGVSHARNVGLDYAQGKYILFLDGDDLLERDTISELLHFFDNHYFETDLVTYKLTSYRNDENGEVLPDHYRYSFLIESGVYDLESYPYITQTTMNIMVKNKYTRNIHFCEDMSFTEDQAYCFAILKDKMKIGYCSRGGYKYIRHEKSSSTALMSPAYLFEQCMLFWEKLFEQYMDRAEIPSYLQAAYVNDLSWKIQSNILFPYHYRETELFFKSINRISKLMTYVSADIIMEHPGVLDMHKYFFLQLRKRRDLFVLENKNSISLIESGKWICTINKINLVCKQVSLREDTYGFKGCISEGILNFCEKISLYREIIWHDGRKQSEEIKIFEGADSWYQCHAKTNKIWSFYDRLLLHKDMASISYVVKIGLSRMNTHLSFVETTPFFERQEEKRLLGQNVIFSMKNNIFKIEELSREKKSAYLAGEIEYYNVKAPDLAYIRKKAEAYENKEVWLYYDSKGVVKDNGFFQFMHDIKKKDNVQRYYVTQNSLRCYEKLVSPDDKKRIIPFGKHKHQALFLKAKKIISAFVEDYNIIPFSKRDYGRIADVLQWDFIYLQHGILHAYVPWKYTYLGNLADKVVISSEYEKRIFTEVFHYPNEVLISTGMPRFDKSLKTSSKDKDEKYILYAPSWRAYLASLNSRGEWVGNEEKLIKTNFYRGLENMFHSKELIRFLKEKNLILKVKLHPIFNIYLKIFSGLQNDKIILENGDIEVEKCALAITDYSSYVFDFAKEKIPVIYFFPDQEEFYSGMNGYYRLTLPLEEGFGPVTDSVEELTKKIEEYIEEDCQEKEIYRKKMDGFFWMESDVMESLYWKLKSEE